MPDGAFGTNVPFRLTKKETHIHMLSSKKEGKPADNIINRGTRRRAGVAAIVVSPVLRGFAEGDITRSQDGRDSAFSKNVGRHRSAGCGL